MPLGPEFRKHLHEVLLEVSETNVDSAAINQAKLIQEAQKKSPSAMTNAYKDAALQAFRTRYEATSAKYLEALSTWEVVIDATTEREMLEELTILAAGPNTLHFPPAIDKSTLQPTQSAYARERDQLAKQLIRAAANRLRELKVKSQRYVQKNGNAAVSLPNPPNRRPSLSSPRKSPSFWVQGQLRLFVSHLAVEKRYAGALKQALAKFEISSFVADEDIAPAKEWPEEIKTALLTCDGLTALLHPGFHESYWTDQEIGYALGRKVPVCAVLLGEHPYGFIGQIQGLHGQGKTASQIAEEIFRVFCRHKRTAKRVSEVALRLFESSDSWGEASERLGTLEALIYWSDQNVERVKEAAKTNGQISLGRGDFAETPRRLDRLVTKWSKRPSSSV